MSSATILARTLARIDSGEDISQDFLKQLVHHLVPDLVDLLPHHLRAATTLAAVRRPSRSCPFLETPLVATLVPAMPVLAVALLAVQPSIV